MLLYVGKTTRLTRIFFFKVYFILATLDSYSQIKFKQCQKNTFQNTRKYMTYG